MKRKTKLFIDKAKDSLLFAIELFNRPSDSCRTEGVIILLDHSFEMLLKAIVLKKRGELERNEPNTIMVLRSVLTFAKLGLT